MAGKQIVTLAQSLKTEYGNGYNTPNSITLSSGVNAINHVVINGIKSQLKIDIDCAVLPDWEVEFKGKYKTIFNSTYAVTGPGFYWFEVISDIDIKEIEKRISAYKLTEGAKALPAIKSRLNYNTKALYIGKVKKDFWGRVVQHLGFYPVIRTQGLQIHHWCAGLDLKLRLHIYEFENDMAGLMPIIENGMALILDPLLGKHLK